jgi:hypothetical protein
MVSVKLSGGVYGQNRIEGGRARKRRDEWLTVNVSIPYVEEYMWKMVI